MSNNSLKIIFRSCTKVEILGPSTRPFNLTKKTITLKCLKSILNSCALVKNKISIDLIDDSSEESLIKEMIKLLKESNLKFKVHRMKFGNNGRSLKYTYQIASKSKEDLIYFCEDDYFHLINAIPSILDAYDSKVISMREFAIFPTDYPSFYVNLFPSLIFIGKYNHWRSVSRTTGTFIITKRIFKKFRNIFENLAEFNVSGHGGEEETINNLWNKYVPCIAPLESLTTHLHTTSMSYLIDWKNEIDKLEI